MASYTRASSPGGTASSRSITASVIRDATAIASASDTSSAQSVSVTALLAQAASQAVGGSVELRRLGGNRAVGANDNPVHPLLRLVELLFAMLLQLRSPFIALDGIVELDLAGFQPPHDLLQFGQRVLEAHRRDVGGPSWIADWRIAHLRPYRTEWEVGCGAPFRA